MSLTENRFNTSSLHFCMSLGIEWLIWGTSDLESEIMWFGSAWLNFEKELILGTFDSKQVTSSLHFCVPLGIDWLVSGTPDFEPRMIRLWVLYLPCQVTVGEYELFPVRK